MGSAGLVQEIYNAFTVAMIISAPPMLAAVGIGLILAIIMAATQIQDQSIPQLVKIIVILVVLIIGGIPLSTPFVEHSRMLFSSFHAMTR